MADRFSIRAWDLEKKIMQEVDCINKHRICINGKWHPRINYELMQSIGATDINDKSIFESDYVRKRSIQYEVYWNGFGFWLRELTTGGLVFIHGDLEIIGNKYEGYSAKL